MVDRIKNFSGTLILIIILFLVFVSSPIFIKLDKKTISYDYIIQDTLVKTIIKKHNEFGVRAVISSSRIGAIGRYKSGYYSTSTSDEVHNTYMFIYNNGGIEKVDKSKYESKKVGDTIKEIRYEYYIDKKTFNAFKGLKIKQVYISYIISEYYEVIYLNNKVIDTTKL